MIFRSFRKRKNLDKNKKSFGDYFLVEKEFSVTRGEGHIQQGFRIKTVLPIAILFFGALLLLLVSVANLQIFNGEEYREISIRNSSQKTILFAERGRIYDRHTTPLAWNEPGERDDVADRHYKGEGFGSLLGFITYPQKDSEGIYYQSTTVGNGGFEELYNQRLVGNNGVIVSEKNALGEVFPSQYHNEPVNGEDLITSIDAEVQSAMYESLKEVANERDFYAGAGALINTETGEILALASYPDFDGNLFTNTKVDQKTKLFNEHPEGTFINRAVSGLYTPGSTVKPFFAVAALEENIVNEQDVITSNGFITVKNIYDQDIEYTFKDWKAHGPLNLYGALAWSSNVYFYYIGGGYGHIKDALGIDRMNFYANIFGFGRGTKLEVFNEPDGLIPNPEWKRNRYETEWTIGDTYNTVIGQYAFQVTPLQLARGVSAIANGGYMLEPHLNKDKAAEKIKLAISERNLNIVKKGMRETVLSGTGKTLNSKNYQLAIKTGTAQIGTKEFLNSLVIGFFPYTDPKYAFAIVMEKGKQDAGLSATRRFFDRLVILRPDYL